MSHYRDHLDAAQARIETLEAKLNERDASLAARDAELAEVRAEVARLRGESNDDGPFDGPDPRGGQRALFAALVMCGLATMTGYTMMRPSHCHQYRSSSVPAVAVRSAPGSLAGRAGIAPMDLGVTTGSEASRARLGMAAALAKVKPRLDVCRPEGDPDSRIEGSVTVTFEPDGGSPRVDLTPPYDGTEVGACVAQIYRSARVPRFDGQPVSLTAYFDF